ncbi:MAG TPA: hypothetical protein VMU87_14810 [Stellaceae bacterium]|nr:hypothetical protein [Stellaceae bacterium]
MWIALGLIGALWLVGAVIAPDKNGPSVFGKSKASVEVSQQATRPSAPDQR